MTCVRCPRLGLPRCSPTVAQVSVCSVRPRLQSMVSIIRLDSGKISLCPFHKHSQMASSEPDPGLTEGSVPRCGPAPSEGSNPCWNPNLEGTSVCPWLTLGFALSFSHFSLLEGSISSGQESPLPLIALTRLLLTKAFGHVRPKRQDGC